MPVTSHLAPRTSHDAVWMSHALRLAVRSLGRTAPNPGVGCVLVRDGVLIGAGRHEVCGQAHAEVNALADCRARGFDPAGATAYVTLAPCTRHGRQPPCVLALIAAKIARVVVAIDDPNQDHPTRWLSPANITYDVGCLEATARHLHGGFLSRINRGRPRITGKWAMTLDGNIAAHTGDSGWISSPEALALSRRRRRAFDAILVGSGTAAHDNPKLLSSVPGRTPLRVIVAQHADLALDSHLVATARHAPVLVIHGPNATTEKIAALNQAGVLTHAVADPHDPVQVAQTLGQRGINDLLVEGGAHLHGAWLRAGLYDRIECYLAPITLGGGQSVCAGTGADTIRLGTEWQVEQPPIALGNTLCWRLRRM